MGVKRGDFEGAQLGALAKGSRVADVQLNSVQSGLNALANGLEQYAKSYDSIKNGLKAWGDFFGGEFDNEVRRREQEDAASREVQDIMTREGKNGPHVKAAQEKLTNIQGQQGLFMKFCSGIGSIFGGLF